MNERFNQTLLNMLGTLKDHQKEDRQSFAHLVHAYNVTRHDSTVFSPNFLMFGRHLRLAVNAYLRLNQLLYDSREYIVDIGDRVLIRNVGLKGKYKLADKWDKDSYIVLC